DEFLATLAHALRTPLAPIRSSVQLLRRSSTRGHEMTEVEEIIERQVKHMVRLVDDLLEGSRITSGRIQLRQEPMSLADAVRDALETSRPLLNSGQHAFTMRLPETPVIVSGDLVRLTQVVANLLNNAAKYTPEGGKISLTLEQQGRWAQ